MQLSIARLSNENRLEFYQIHSVRNGEGGCNCVAWWVPHWDGWGDRTAEENQAMRDSLFERGEFDGYLLYVDGVAVGWAQCGPRDRFEKLAKQYRLEDSPETWALTCFLLLPEHRG